MEILSHWGSDYGAGPGMMSGFGMGFGPGGFGFIMMIVVWILVVVGIVFLIKWLAASSRAAGGGQADAETPMDILKKRYARGEIDKAEFEERKKDLAG